MRTHRHACRARARHRLLEQTSTTGVATGGMIPKLETAMAAVRAGVEAVVILDGRRPHAMLVELFTEFGAGTLVKAS
jgi:acetylglutamate kinase